MRSWKDFITSYAFVYIWCAVVAWDVNPAEWTETMRMVWMILGFFVFAMVHNQRNNDEQ